jgi:voltage-gated potassium channel
VIRAWERVRLPRRVLVTLTVPAALTLIGTVGYRAIEGPHWSILDALYMTVITLCTVGYLEVHELSPAGRLFTIFLCFGGIFTLFFTATETIRAVVYGEFKELFGRQRMEQELAALTGHVVVCGYGRMGRIVCQEFERQGERYVVLDKDQARLADLELKHGVPLHGDATEDEALRKAGVERAKALITVCASDADNLYITLSARLLNPKLQIVARAEEEEAEGKLRRVGANKVISPYLAGGHRVVQAVLKPTVVHFLEMAARPEFIDLAIEEIKVTAGSPLAGQTLRQTRMHQDYGVTVVGILRPDGELTYTPQGDTVIEPDTVLVALGQTRQLETLARLAGGQSTAS